MLPLRWVRFMSLWALSWLLQQAGVAFRPDDNVLAAAPLQVYSLVVGSFRSWLSGALVDAARAWGAFSAAEADRLAPLVDSLPSR